MQQARDVTENTEYNAKDEEQKTCRNHKKTRNPKEKSNYKSKRNWMGWNGLEK